MARRRYSFDEKKIARFVKEGRGEGHGRKYKPWLTIQDVPSPGRRHRVPGLAINRTHHLLSDLERDAFYLYDWADSVTDIREQFPLDRTVTQRIAGEIGVQHPLDRETRIPLVMTTDLLIDVDRDGKTVLLARTMKYAEELDKPRTIEKFEIERRYWAERQIDWGIVTERDIPETAVKNIGWIHGRVSLEDLSEPNPGYYVEKAALILREIPTHQSLTVDQFCAEMDTTLVMRSNECLMIFRYLLASKLVRCDVTQRPLYDGTLPLSYFMAAPSASARASA